MLDLGITFRCKVSNDKKFSYFTLFGLNGGYVVGVDAKMVSDKKQNENDIWGFVFACEVHRF